MNILHLVHDEKFISFVVDVFNACEGVENSFIAIVPNVSGALKYLSDMNNVRIVDKSYIQSKALSDDLAWCDCLVVHYLDEQKSEVILRAPEHLPVLWSGWGADYYDLLPMGGINLLGDETLRLHRRMERKKDFSIINILRLPVKMARRIVKKVLFTSRLKATMKRIDYFSSPIPEDYDLLKSHLGADFRADYVQLSYGSVEHTFAPGPALLKGNNILVGNSASATNNHLEVFKILSRLDLGNRKIVTPLSYGDTDYRDEIIAQGRDIFGENFQPIVEFMPLEEYNTLIAECSMVVMGHRRQQAVGNIAMMLYKGAKIFLDEVSTVYQFFKGRGAVIYCLHDLKDSGDEAFIPLTNAQKKKNREVLENFWGHDVILKNVVNCVELLRVRGVMKRA